MMGHIKISTEDVQRIGTMIQSSANARRAELSTLGSQADPGAVWDSVAAHAYVERFEAWRQAEQNLIEALNGLGQAVAQIAQNFNEIDGMGASAFRS